MRLTVKQKAGVNEIVVHKNCHEEFCGFRHCENCKNQVEVFERLFELENKLESGQAFELQCKVGDAVYQTDTDGTKIYCSTVQRIIIDNQRVIYCTDSVDFDERAIGNSIFLTAEAAEARAKELQEKL